MSKWLIYSSAESQHGRVGVRPDAIVAVVSTPDAGSRIILVGGDEVGVTASALSVLKVLSDPPPPPANVTATMASPTVDTPTISGTAEPGATITVVEGETVLGKDVADASGNWSINTSPLAPGNHSIAAQQTDVVGNTSDLSHTLELAVEAAPPPEPPVVTEAPPTEQPPPPPPAPPASPPPPPPASPPAPPAAAPAAVPQPAPAAEKPKS